MSTDDHTFPAIYRGVCVSNVDIENRGRIDVTVPQVTGPDLIINAWPCRPVSDLTVAPAKPGQGVWVMFEGGHPDKPVWIGVF